MANSSPARALGRRLRVNQTPAVYGCSPGGSQPCGDALPTLPDPVRGVVGQQPRELDPLRSPRDLFGWQLRRLREVRGLSQEALGLEVHLSGAAIGSYERGRSLPAEDEARRLDEVLGGNGLLFASWHLDAQSTQHADGHADSAAVSMRGDARPVTMETPDRPPTLEDQLSASAELAAEFGAWTEQLQGGAVMLEVLHQRVRRLAHSCLTLPPGAVMRYAEPLSREVFRLAREPRKPAVARDMYALAAQLCTLLGWLAGDLGALDAAELHARAAWASADAAQDAESSAWALALQAKNAFWRRDFLGSAELAQRGQRHAGAGTSLLMLVCQEADAYSELGATQPTVEALRRADDGAEQIRTADTLGGLFGCSPARHAAYAAACNLRLGADYADRALTEAERGLGLADERTSFGSVAQLHITRTLAQASAGRIDAAAEAARPVLELPPPQRMATVVGRLKPLAGLLDRPSVRSSPLARDLRAQVLDFCDAADSRRALPSGTEDSDG